MLLHINYEDAAYDFDLDEIDISEATVIYRKYELTLLKFQLGLAEANPDALRAAFWLMQKQNGKNINIDNVNFKPVKFANAIDDAARAAKEEQDKAEDTGGPKETT